MVASAIVANKTIEDAFSSLINRIRSYNPFVDLERLNAAYDTGKKAHNGQFRASGEAYFSHPIAVGYLLADMHLDTDTIITALLHDTVEDCDITLQDISDQFGNQIANLVDGVTKLSQIENQSPDKRQAENFRKLMVAISQDIRVLLVKLADRLHNMQTIESINSLEKKERIAKETLEIFVPLAERLGITQFQTELEDTSFPFDYGDFDGFSRYIEKYKGEVAAVILEPMRYALPDKDFLLHVRNTCNKHNIVMIFDEISSGFRFNNSATHLDVNVIPDIVVYVIAIFGYLKAK